ncbi:hypothetical protein PVL29_006380 [Vitis rotundifolia]|uniref:Uncharacterized protein n=1 Tax=Vitis rotundifolia TaxID=103349 RepID=A0AA39A4V7_VITRO|nr:hypothetical protein PVL29_006380 [Vitis rotundifolia]
MTTQGARSPTTIRFSIDGCQGILDARHIAKALHIPFQPEDSTHFRQWSHISQRDMVRILLRGTSGDSFILRKELPSGMLLLDVLLRFNIFPLQHLVQRRRPILDSLFRIFEGFYFGPYHLIMAALLSFEEKVHRKKLQRADTTPLLFPRLLCHILEHMGYPSEPHLESYSTAPAAPSMPQATSTDPPASSPIPPAAPATSEAPMTISTMEFRAMTHLFKTLTFTHNALFQHMRDIRAQ